VSPSTRIARRRSRRLQSSSSVGSEHSDAEEEEEEGQGTEEERLEEEEEEVEGAEEEIEGPEEEEERSLPYSISDWEYNGEDDDAIFQDPFPPYNEVIEDLEVRQREARVIQMAPLNFPPKRTILNVAEEEVDVKHNIISDGGLEPASLTPEEIMAQLARCLELESLSKGVEVELAVNKQQLQAKKKSLEECRRDAISAQKERRKLHENIISLESQANEAKGLMRRIEKQLNEMMFDQLLLTESQDSIQQLEKIETEHKVNLKRKITELELSLSEITDELDRNKRKKVGFRDVLGYYIQFQSPESSKDISSLTVTNETQPTPPLCSICNDGEKTHAHISSQSRPEGKGCGKTLCSLCAFNPNLKVCPYCRGSLEHDSWVKVFF